MDNKKLNYTAPFTRNLDTYFEGVICASGAASGDFNTNVNASQAGRYQDGGVQTWNLFNL